MGKPIPGTPGSSLFRLSRWKTVFAGWQLGTRPKGDPECDAVRDHRELSMVLRVEKSAIAALLIEKGVFTEEEYNDRIEEEAEALMRMYEKRFPGIKATDQGIHMNPQVAVHTMRGWRP